MKHTALLTSLLLCLGLNAQDIRNTSELEGHWAGAFIRGGNSIQLCELYIRAEGDSLSGAFRIPEWPYYESFRTGVSVNDPIVEFETYYGLVTMLLDSSYSEMIGECDFANVHLKKALRNPRRSVVKEDVVFKLDDIAVEGTVTRPDVSGKLPTVLLVHGRGCGSKNDWYDRPALLAQYGMAVVTFDKRGHERTGYDCEKTSMKMHASDLTAISKQVRKLSYTGSLGFIGYSAGGWVAPMASAMMREPVDFIISVVGPSTSVKQQQLDCSVYYLRDGMGLDERAVNEAVAYCEMEFSDMGDTEIYNGLMSLLDSAKIHGWMDVLEESDIPGSPEEVDKLWVRRNRYDPASDLASFSGPFLAILGGSDYVVPWKENLDRYEDIFEGEGKTNYTVTVVPSANHGMENGHLLRDLGYNNDLNKWYAYFKFDRVAPGAIDEMVVFLRKHDIIQW